MDYPVCPMKGENPFTFNSHAEAARWLLRRLATEVYLELTPVAGLEGTILRRDGPYQKEPQVEDFLIASRSGTHEVVYRADDILTACPAYPANLPKAPK